MTVLITVSEGRLALRSIRELACAAVEMPQAEPTPEERLVLLGMFVLTMADCIRALDLYLTDSSQNRDTSTDRRAGATMLAGGENMQILLSDNESVLLVRLPTEGNPESVTMSFPARPKNATAYHRWQLLDSPESQPNIFNPPKAR